MFLDMYKRVVEIFDKNYNKAKHHSIKDKNFLEKKLIGEGGFGYVYLVQDSNGQNYAIKIINICSNSQLNSVYKELKIWQEISKKCEYVVKLIDHEIINIEEDTDKRTTSCIAVAKCLMEYSSEGTLLDYINNTIINEDEIISIVINICEFLNAFHELNFTHRDIKPENVLKFKDKFKVCDFGSCTDETFLHDKLGKKEMIKKKDEFEKISTFNYRPPEILDKFSEFDIDNKVDIWMLGCLTYLCAFRKHPFDNSEKLGIINCIYNFDESNLEIHKISISDKFKDLIRIMLNPNPYKRPTSKILLNALKKWINKSKKQMNSIDSYIFEEDIKIKYNKNTAIENKTGQEILVEINDFEFS